MPRARNNNRDSIRSERISLALTPAVFDGIKTLADIKAVTVNELLNAVAAELVKKNAVAIKEYDAARAKAAEKLNLSVSFRVDTIDDRYNNGGESVAAAAFGL